MQCMLLQHCQSFDFFESGMYTYRQIIGSRSSMQNPKNIQAHLELMERWVQMAVSADFRVHLNAYLSYTIVLGMGYSWQVALLAVFVEGLIFIVLSLTQR